MYLYSLNRRRVSRMVQSLIFIFFSIRKILHFYVLYKTIQAMIFIFPDIRTKIIFILQSRRRVESYWEGRREGSHQDGSGCDFQIHKYLDKTYIAKFLKEFVYKFCSNIEKIKNQSLNHLRNSPSILYNAYDFCPYIEKNKNQSLNHPRNSPSIL